MTFIECPWTLNKLWTLSGIGGVLYQFWVSLKIGVTEPNIWNTKQNIRQPWGIQTSSGSQYRGFMELRAVLATVR